MRLAVLSGPRNISTALMRSFGQRMRVVDEPLYAYYLARTGLQHPAREAVLASQPRDWRDAVAALDALPEPVYEKHMAQHLLPEVDLDWLARRRVVLLLRHPAEVIRSYAKVHGDFDATHIGPLQQLRVWEHLSASGQPPVVLDSACLLRDPPRVLPRLCARLGLAWDPAMLRWPPGPRPEDGVWAPHWYDAVYASTGFAPYSPRPREVAPQHQATLEALMPAYLALRGEAERQGF